MRRLIVADRLETPAGHERGRLLVLPNRQAARAAGIPHSSLEDLAKRVMEDAGLALVSPLVGRRLLRAAAERYGGGNDPAGFARAAAGTVRELLRAGADLELLSASSEQRVARLAAVAAGYVAALRRACLLDPAELLWRAAERTPRRLRLRVMGFPRLPAAERAWIDAVAAPGSEVHLPLAAGPLFEENREAAADFERRGWRIEEGIPGDGREGIGGPAGRGPGPARVELGVGLARLFAGLAAEAETSANADAKEPGDESVSAPGAEAARTPGVEATTTPGVVEALAFPDLDAEVRGVLMRVKRLLLAGTSTDKVAIVARDEQTYGPRLLAVAEEFRLPLRALYLVPLADSRFGNWLTQALTAIIEGLPFETTARLLAHPLAARLDGAGWHAVRASRPQGSGAWLQHAPELAALDWPEKALRQDYRSLLLQLLERLDVRRRALAWPREAIAFNTFSDELRGLPDGERETSLEGFAAEVSELLSGLQVPARPDRGGVELHSPLSLFGARVEHLFVVGLAEGHLPSPVRADPLLDPFEREALRAQGHPVESVTLAARREELSFWALLHSANESLTLSHPKLLGRRESLPSPYLARLRLAAVGAGAGPPASLAEWRRGRLRTGEDGDQILDLARRSFSVEARRESEASWDGHDGMVGVPYQPPRAGVGVSRLIDLASCPFRFFAKALLRLSAPPESAGVLEAALRGQLYHQALQLATERAVGAADLRTAALEQLPAAFAESEEQLRLGLIPTWELERSEHLAVLRRAILGEGFSRDGSEVLALEQEFSGSWRGIPVRGRVDRLDTDTDGVTLIDYKSGAGVSQLAKDREGRAKVDLQLPIYREAAAPQLAPGRTAATPIYYSVSKARPIRMAEPAEAELERIADQALAAWRDGAYPVDPDLDGKACGHCDFPGLCRKGPRIERKQGRK